MRVLKEPEVRRNEILDAAGELFMINGFDGTSTNEILEKAGIARGTLYYYFKSKEAIMDALIERQNTSMLAAASEIAADKSISVSERIIRVILSQNIEESNSPMLELINKPQNALMHQKVQKVMIMGLTPIITSLVEEGIEQGLFSTPYPYESVEMLLTYASVLFDDNDIIQLTQEETISRAQAFLYNMEHLLGTKEGTFAALAKYI
ncbi:MAG: TetR/AcrR family transcriptional regulator [Lachnospiraceae bacterium]